MPWQSVILVCIAAFAALGALCDPPAAKPTEISRERAIEIARQEVHLDADGVEAVRATSEGRSVWRVTFKKPIPDHPLGFFDIRIIEIDVRTGKIVSVTTS